MSKLAWHESKYEIIYQKRLSSNSCEQMKKNMVGKMVWDLQGLKYLEDIYMAARFFHYYI